MFENLMMINPDGGDAPGCDTGEGKGGGNLMGMEAMALLGTADMYKGTGSTKSGGGKTQGGGGSKGNGKGGRGK